MLDRCRVGYPVQGSPMLMVLQSNQDVTHELLLLSAGTERGLKEISSKLLVGRVKSTQHLERIGRSFCFPSQQILCQLMVEGLQIVRIESTNHCVAERKRHDQPQQAHKILAVKLLPCSKQRRHRLANPKQLQFLDVRAGLSHIRLGLVIRVTHCCEKLAPRLQTIYQVEDLYRRANSGAHQLDQALLTNLGLFGQR